MTLRSLIFMLCLLAAAVFLPPVLEPRPAQVRAIDEMGRDLPCPPAFATVREPDRTGASLTAIWEDFAYAAAAAGARGSAALLCGVALVVVLLAMWVRGLRCALRRLLVTLAVGAALAIALIYTSSFLEGRNILLGPEAGRFLPASLHTQTNRTTGLLTPQQVVRWHYKRGFRVLCVTDKDSTASAELARRSARDLALEPSLLVLVGEEWHGHPDLILIHLRRAWDPGRLALEETIEGVRKEGGISILAHPWSKVLPRSLEDLFDAGVDGVEVVNGVIHGGVHLLQKATNSSKVMLGVIDYKYGPHVNALTLLPARLARTPPGVVEALRTRQTRVLYAVPGGTIAGEVYEAGTLGTSGAVAGMRSLLETPLPRRATWFLWLAGITLLWWGATRTRRSAMRKRQARILFVVCLLVEFCLPAGLSWQVREAVGAIPVDDLLAAAALVAVPLLAASHALACIEAEA